MDFAKFFKSGKRDNGETFYALTDNAPEWLSDAVFEAHDLFDLMPHDWVYSVCAEFANDFDSDWDEDSLFEWADSGVDVCTHGLMTWVSDNLAFSSLVDELRDEFGDAGNSFANEIMRAQCVARERIARVLFDAVQEVE